MRLAILPILLLANCAAHTATRQAARIDAEPRTEEEQREQTRADLEELLARAKARARTDAGVAPKPEAVPPQPAETVAPLPADPFDDLLPAGHISAQALNRFYAAGPATLLRALETEPARIDGKLVGFRIVAVAPNAAFVRRAQLLPGDIIRSVNGASILTPDDFMKVWSTLPKVTALDINLLRGSESVTRHWDIEQPPTPPAP